MWIETQDGGLANLGTASLVLARPHRFGDRRHVEGKSLWLVEAVYSDSCGPIELAAELTEADARAAVYGIKLELFGVDGLDKFDWLPKVGVNAVMEETK